MSCFSRFVSVLTLGALLALAPSLAVAGSKSQAADTSADLASEGTAWITLDEAAYGSARELFPAGLSGDALPRVDAASGVILTRVPRSEIPKLAEHLHRTLRRCGGFFAHESLEQAREALDRVRSPIAIDGALPFTIDQPQWAAQLSAAVDESEILSMLTALSTNFPNRYHAHHAVHRSADWIRDQWAGHIAGHPTATVELVAHPGITPQPSVVLTIPGSTLPDELVIFGAHQDSIVFGCSANPQCNAPGADDDGSGISVLSELIRVAVTTGFTPNRTVQFIGYAAEEVGLEGSDDIAASYQASGTNAVAVLQLDMTGYHGSSEDIILITDHTDSDLNAFLGQLLDTYLPSLVWSTGTCGYACSDHASWNSRGFRAAFPFESRIGSHNPAIHSGGDTVGNLGSSAAHAVKFGRLAAVFLAETALDGAAGLFADGFESGNLDAWSEAAP